MKLIKTIAEMQQFSKSASHHRQKIGVVPTMGYLHEGHMSLIDQAHKLADVVIVTIFVNPTQFGPNEDLAKYPRDFDRDWSLCEKRGVDALRLHKTPDPGADFGGRAERRPSQKLPLMRLHPHRLTAVGAPPLNSRLKYPRMAAQ